MQNDFHFKFLGCELRAIGPLAIVAAIIALVLIFSPAREGLYSAFATVVTMALAQK